MDNTSYIANIHITSKCHSDKNNLSFDFPSTNSKTVLSRSWSEHWAWSWLNILFLATGTAPFGSCCNGPNILLKCTKHSAILERLPYISVKAKLLSFSISSSPIGLKLASTLVSPWLGLVKAATINVVDQGWFQQTLDPKVIRTGLFLPFSLKLL